MADQTISSLTQNPSITGTEEMAIEKDGLNFKNTFLQLKDWFLEFVSTVFIQTKRPIKTVNSQSLEGIGNIVISGGTVEEDFSSTVLFNGDEIQVHNQESEILIDLAATGHSEGSSTLIQEIIGGGQLLNLSSKLLDKLKGDNINPLKKNKLFYIHDSRLSGDVYGRTEVTNYTSDLTSPIILSAVASNTSLSDIVVVFNGLVNVAGTTNTLANFTVGTSKTITGVSGTGTNTITYSMSADIDPVDVISIDYSAPSDITSVSTGDGLIAPLSFSVNNQVVNDAFPVISSLQRRWDSYQGVFQDDSTGFLSKWVDSENGSEMLQNALLNQPSINTSDSNFSSQPSFTFNGTSSFMIDSSLDLTGSQKATVIMVMKAVDIATATSGYDAYAFYGNTLGNNTFGLRSVTGTASIYVTNKGNVGVNNYRATSNLDPNGDQLAAFTVELDYSQVGNLDSKIYTDNVLLGVAGGSSENTGSFGKEDFILGDFQLTGGRYAKMNLAAVYVFDDVLTAQNKTDLATFINDTYGI